MSYRYSCEKCEYYTNKTSNYKHHLISTKHVKQHNVENMDVILKEKQFRCEYCKNVYANKANKSNHYGVCKQKRKYEKEKLRKKMDQENALEDKKELQKRIKKLEADKEKLETEKRELEAEKKLLETDKKEVYDDYITVLKNMGPKTINNNNSFTVKNTHYILNHYNNARNLEDVLEPPLTEEEIERIQKHDPTYGCITLLDNRCIADIELSERPFHCVDTSRSKYVVFTDNQWQIDERGQKILRQVYPKVRPMFPMEEDGVYITENIKGLIEMESNPSRILKFIDESSSHSANLAKANNTLLLENGSGTVDKAEPDPTELTEPTVPTAPTDPTVPTVPAVLVDSEDEFIDTEDDTVSYSEESIDPVTECTKMLNRSRRNIYRTNAKYDALGDE